MFQAMIFAAAWGAGVLGRTKRANLEAAENRAERAEAELDRHATREAAAERARIARELHDVVEHHVSLMAVQAEAATSLLPDKPAQAHRSVEIIGNTARLALAELHRLLGVLRGPSERLGGGPAGGGAQAAWRAARYVRAAGDGAVGAAGRDRHRARPGARCRAAGGAGGRGHAGAAGARR